MRKDGIRIKNVNPMYLVMHQFLRERHDAMNMITMDIPVGPLKEYILSKKEQGIRLTHLGLVISAYVRTLAEYPELNRFIVNRKIYARNEIAVAMVVLKSGSMSSETMSKMYFLPEDDIYTVQKTIDDYINGNKKTENSNGTDRIIGALLGIPGLLRFGCSLFRWMDRHGLLPKAVIDVSPFHASCAITNLASVRTNHIYHHIYDFGTISEFFAMGSFREVPRRTNGKVSFETCLPIGIVMDERICTGAYCAMALQRFKSYLAHPERLEGEPKVIANDGVEIRKKNQA